MCEFSKRQTNDDVNEIKFISFFLLFASQVCTRTIPVLASSDNVTRYDFDNNGDSDYNF